jgi:F0F1-type ATP synthase membrane subunit b/b'
MSFLKNILFACVAFLIFTENLYASSKHQATFSSILYPLINFIIFSVICFVIAKPRLLKSYVARVTNLKNASIQAEKQFEEANLKLGTIKGRLDSIDEEIMQMRTEMHKLAELEASEISINAQKIVSQIERDARVRVNISQKNAQDELEEYLAKLVAKRAKELTIDSFSTEEDKKIRDLIFTSLAQDRVN